MDNETREEYTRRLAKNRYDMRMNFKWKLSDTAEDDWKAAERMVMADDRRKCIEEIDFLDRRKKEAIK